jgi:radical SAM superfamily enzyme YgiQ (UPF0313 family)
MGFVRDKDDVMADRMDVLLVTPPSRLEVYQDLSAEFAAIEPPVWSGLIANFMRRHGHAVAMLDAEAEGLTHAETAQRITDANPRLAVFVIYGQQPSASTQCMPDGRKVCEIVNEESDIPTLVMGTHASALPESTLLDEPYTYVCQGEGPLTVLGLTRALAAGDGVEAVPGLWYMNGGVARSTPVAGKLTDLDTTLSGQAWDLLDMSLYRAHNWQCLDDLSQRSRYASVQTSLGCPYKCSFCCINAPFGGNGIRYWSPENFIAQVDHLVENYGTRIIKIPDEMFVLNKRHVLGICDLLIERDYDLNFWAYARIDTMQPEFLDKLRRAGIRWLGIGIESASKFVRDGMTKGKFGDDDIRQTIRRIRDAGLYISANYIFGLPDDTHESMQETLDMALQFNTEWANFYSAMAYPGSPLYAMAKENGWPLPDDAGGPGWIGYSQHAFETLPLPTEHLSAQEVLDFRDRAFDRYFTSSAYLSLTRDTFGDAAAEHINAMTSHSLKRRHHEQGAPDSGSTARPQPAI